MSVKQTMLDIRVPPDIANSRNEIQRRIENVLNPRFGIGDPILSTSDNGNPTLWVTMYIGRNASQWTVRSFPDNLITLDIVDYVVNNNQRNITEKEIEELELCLEESLSGTSHLIPAITRGDNKIICNYFDTTDGRLKEYDFDRIVYEETSEYQEILIAHSNQFGNMLFLDMFEMIAESDIAYTKALLGNGQEDYSGKTVLILGGGDGGVLHEVLKELPKFVIMVDIDKAVIDASVKYLRGVCGSSMDSFSGDNYEIRIDDCVKVLHEFIAEGRTFDFVINDLTDIPIATEPQESLWELIRKILQLSLRVLAPDGKYFNQSIGVNCTDALTKYEKQFEKLDCSIEFNQFTAFVPSFMERWAFYKIWKTSS